MEICLLQPYINIVVVSVIAIYKHDYVRLSVKLKITIEKIKKKIFMMYEMCTE